MSTFGMYISKDLADMETWSITPPHLGKRSGDDSGIKANVVSIYHGIERSCGICP